MIRPFDMEHFCAENLTFSWEGIEYTKDKLLIQLYFDQTDCISASSNTGDSLEIVFYDQRLFKDTIGNIMIPKLNITHPVPR